MTDTNNLAIWDKLGKTDPAHTKGFKRGGGFTGTAIKPIYTEQKMTEQFGPVGTGWGFSEPKFQLVPGENKELLVYCWLTLWYVLDGKRSGDIPGVGGDKVIGYIKANVQYNRPERWENDDEAFKKAFTDAIGNAMKHLGMSADVHMGLFDDSKYVAEVERELSQGPAFTQPQPKAASRELHQSMLDKVIEAGRKGRAALRDYWQSEEFIAGWEIMPDDWKKILEEEKDGFLASYSKPTGRVDPNTSLDQQFAATVAN